MEIPVFGGGMYDPAMTAPMREELTSLGVESLETPEAVDLALKDTKGTVLVVVNSVCGCAAGNARPSMALALQHATRPDRSTTVFAGVDKEAVAQAREYFGDLPPSSPSFVLMKDGQPVFAIPRLQVEGRTPEQIAESLTTAFDEHCA